MSPVYETDPVGGPVQDDFLNAVVAVDTDLAPHELLARRAGASRRAAARVRDVRWGPRTLDVDVLLVGDERVDDPDLDGPAPPDGASGPSCSRRSHDLDPELALAHAGRLGGRAADAG